MEPLNISVSTIVLKVEQATTPTPGRLGVDEINTLWCRDN